MKKNTLRIICAALSLVFLLGLVGCAPRNPRVAFFLYNAGDTFILELWNNMKEKMPAGVYFEEYDAGNSQVVQNQQIVEAISRGDFDLFVINAVDRLACNAIVEKCTKKEIPLIFFNREPPEDALFGSNVFCVSSAADSEGEKQANMVAELFTRNFSETAYDRNGDGVVQLVIIKGEQGHQDTEKRTDNCIGRLKELGYETQVLAIEVANWKRQEGYEAMRLLYRQFGDEIELVFSNNDDMALGAIDFLLEQDVFHEAADGLYNQPFVIVGVDGTTVGLQAIQKGLLYGTVNNDSQKQASAIMTLVEYVIRGEGFEDLPYPITNKHYIYIEGDIITYENLSKYVSPNM